MRSKMITFEVGFVAMFMDLVKSKQDKIKNRILSKKIDALDKKKYQWFEIWIPLNQNHYNQFISTNIFSSSMNDGEIVEGYLYYSLQTKGSEISTSQRE